MWGKVSSVEQVIDLHIPLNGGTDPSLLSSCPPVVFILFTRCWSSQNIGGKLTVSPSHLSWSRDRLDRRRREGGAGGLGWRWQCAHSCCLSHPVHYQFPLQYLCHRCQGNDDQRQRYFVTPPHCDRPFLTTLCSLTLQSSPHHGQQMMQSGTIRGGGCQMG